MQKIKTKVLIKFLPLFSLTAFMPLVALAVVLDRCTGPGVGRIICRLGELLSAVIPVLVALGIVYFVWGVVQYFIASDEDAKKTGKDRIIFGIIGLAVIISVWGLVRIVTDTFQTEGVAPTNQYLQELLPQ